MTDFDRVQCALGGDMTALDALYRTYICHCIERALRLGATVEDAWDVSQELFVRLAAGRGWRIDPTRLPPDGSLFGYLSGAVKHMTRTAHRRRGLGTGGDPEYAGQVLEASPVWPLQTDNPEDQLLRKERIARLRWAMATLSQRQQQIAKLRYFECLSGPDIGARLGISPSNVFSQLYQIREALRPHLACAYQVPEHSRYGFVKFSGGDRPRKVRQERYRATRRRARTLGRQRVA